MIQASGDLARLRRLARLYEVQTAYVDQNRQRIVASPAALLGALRGLGALVDDGDLQAAIDARQRELWYWRLEPVLIAWEGKLPPVTLRLPGTEAAGKAACTLTLESGETLSWQVDLAAAPVSGRQELGGRPYVEVDLGTARTLPLGYHRLAVEAGSRRLEALVIAAPWRAYQASNQRRWGVFLPLYALHAQDTDIGDFGTLGRLCDWSRARDADFVATLPLLASFLDQPFDPSPYAPASRLFWNELYVSTQDGRPSNLDSGPLVDYRAAMAAKRVVLEQEAEALWDSTEAVEFEAFRRERPAVEDYARFRAAVEKLGLDWRRWPARQRAGELAPADYEAETARYYAYAQWRADQQLRGLEAKARAQGCGLFLDLPVGVHPLGYDAWRYQEQFASDVSVGAPPDVVTTSGQDWGFAPLLPEALRRSGYEYVIAYLRHHLAAANRLRIDHVMGLRRLYWVPRGASARDGVYVDYRPDEMFAILSLESHRQQAQIAGENLGIVPGPINRGLATHGLAGMYVMSIELRENPEQPLRLPPPHRSLASLGTHDLPPFAAFWQASDIELRVNLGVLDASRAAAERRAREGQKTALLAYLHRHGLLADESLEAVLRACLTLLAQSRAGDLLVSLEDLWLEPEPQNVPGTQADQYPSWRRRARYSLEEIESLRAVREALDLVRRLRPAKGAS